MTISIVGVEDDLERRIGMAVRLLGAAEVDARIEPWDGSRRDVLVVDADDAYGNAAAAVANRRGDAVLAVTRQQEPLGTLRLIQPNVQVAELTRLLRELAPNRRGAANTPVRRVEAVPAQTASGLLGVCLAQSGDEDFVARSGPFTLLVRRLASRVAATSHSDLAAARSRFLDESWTGESARSAAFDGEASISQSLDALLIEGCEANAARLAPLAGRRHRLRSWPDLGSIPDNTDALRLASALVKRDWSVNELAAHCQVGPERANAFCWAMRASGLLASDAHAPAQVQAAALSLPVRSILARLAQRFGLRMGMAAAS